MFPLLDMSVLLWVCFLGTLFWPLNPDAAVLVYVGPRGRPLLEAAAVALLGQAVMLLLLQVMGHRLRARWGWLDRKCEAVGVRWGARIKSSSAVVAAVSGLVGIPPSVATVLLASALGIPARRTLPILFVFRGIWFLALGRFGTAIMS